MFPTLPRRAIVRASALLVPLLTLAACADTPTHPLVPEEPTTERPEPRVLGVIEITLTGIAADGALETRALSVSTIAMSPQSAPGNADASGDGTIQLEPVSTGSFTVGTRADGGHRYISATYRVRNAQRDGTPYDTPRRNLTFYAVDTDGTLGETAISRLHRFDGSAAATDPASILPTGAVRLDPVTTTVLPAAPDVLQLLTEAEAADLLTLAGAGTRTVFPYGFVVRNPNSSATRALAANPAEDQFDGVVTFAFKIPLATDPADDPFTVSAVFMAVDDDEVRITQSLEEQTATGDTAFLARAITLNATTLTLLQGSTFAFPIPTRNACAARTAGSAHAPLARIGGTTRFLGLSPDPFAAGGSNRFLTINDRIQAAFDAPVDGLDAANFVVRGSQSGLQFRGTRYTGNGTDTVTAPWGLFRYGEEVEVVVTETDDCVEGLPYVARMRVVSGPADGRFNNYPYYLDTGALVHAIAVADIDGDGLLDVVSTNFHGNSITVRLNDPRGPVWGERHDTHVGSQPVDAAIGDLDSNGTADLVVAVGGEARIAVLSGNGNGTFTTASSVPLAGGPSGIRLGDLNGDGIPDLIAPVGNAGHIAVALGNGNGTFQPVTIYPVDGPSATLVELADFDGDGALDMVTAYNTGHGAGQIAIRNGNGDGTFGPAHAFTAPSYPEALAVADLDGDGIPDIAYGYAAPHGSRITVYTGQGDGTTFAEARTLHLTGQHLIHGLVAADVHGDGLIDLVAATNSPGAVWVLRNDGNLGFATNQWYDFPSARGVALGDFNGNRKLDIAAGNGDPTRGENFIHIFGNDCSLYDC